MAARVFLLKPKRRQLSELLEFLERVAVGVECGLDLSYVWQLWKPWGKSSTFLEQLRALSENPLVPETGPWFLALLELYREGAPIVPFLRAFCDALRDSLRLEVERHERELPTRLNIVLLIFSLPPVFVLLFGPLLRALTASPTP